MVGTVSGAGSPEKRPRCDWVKEGRLFVLEESMTMMVYQSKGWSGREYQKAAMGKGRRKTGDQLAPGTDTE